MQRCPKDTAAAMPGCRHEPDADRVVAEQSGADDRRRHERRRDNERRLPGTARRSADRPGEVAGSRATVSGVGPPSARRARRSPRSRWPRGVADARSALDGRTAVCPPRRAGDAGIHLRGPSHRARRWRDGGVTAWPFDQRWRFTTAMPKGATPAMSRRSAASWASREST